MSNKPLIFLTGASFGLLVVGGHQADCNPHVNLCPVVQAYLPDGPHNEKRPEIPMTQLVVTASSTSSMVDPSSMRMQFPARST